ncbi:protein CLT1, chloroplastic isoform X1 [Mangifera indica]|uniref:protein CLT1, chloroplastic isoform X1 n=1 Tax=Mangifera indica TaxID=29780 RepID=UPI001CFB50FD|nr:protein CLT1, chloroplastic isoform X1 [Mangifera indica]
MASSYRQFTAGPSASHTTIFESRKPTRTAVNLCLLRDQRNHRPWLVLKSLKQRSNSHAAWLGGVWERSEGEEAVVEKKKAGTWSYAVEKRRSSDENSRKVEVVVAAAVTVVLGVGNRVLYKLALVPLKHYPFFLAQLATLGYVVVYYSILYLRYHAGIVTDEMLSMPKAPFLLVGLLEALAAATGMAAGAILSGASIPILSQTFLVWQILLSFIFLGRRYRVNQLLGCFLVAIGVIITVASGSSGHSLKDAGIFWSILMIISFLLQAADTVLKEIIFKNAAERLKGGSVDLFVVNSYGSAFQALFICILLPFLSKLWGIPFIQLPNYLRDGAACFLNIGTLSNGCDGAPLLPILFILVNMGYNISLLHLLKISSAVVSCLASTFSVPISVYVFTLPLPYLGVASSLPAGFVVGAIILVMGLLIYAWTPKVTSSGGSSSSSTTS